ncbi:MAG: class I SAM-dependent methyltransferase [Solirubrobacterales bacterium]
MPPPGVWKNWSRERRKELRRIPATAGFAVAGTVLAAGTVLGRARTAGVVAAAAGAVVGSVVAEGIRLERETRVGEDALAVADRLGADLYALGNWAIDPDFARLIMKELDARPGLVVELGSGTSTALIAGVLAERGQGRLVTFDHDAHFAEQTRRRVDGILAPGKAEIHVAPLREQEFGGEPVEWYDAATVLAALPEEPIDLLVIDGPPASTKWSRWPAIEALWERVRPGGAALVDDGRRGSETATVRRWVREHDDVQAFWVDNRKGAWRLMKAPAPAEPRLMRLERRLMRALHPRPAGFGHWPVYR